MTTFRFFFESRDVEVKGDFVDNGYDYMRVVVVNNAGGKQTVAAFSKRNVLGYVEVTKWATK